MLRLYESGSRYELRADDERRPSITTAGRTPSSLHRSTFSDFPATADVRRADIGGVRHSYTVTVY